jgi:hypothetical protein
MLSPRASLATWAGNGNPAALSPKGQFNARTISDGNGGMIVTWEDYRSDTADIYAQHFDNSGNQLWGSGGIAICTASFAQVSPMLCSDGSGGAVIVWEDHRQSTESDIYAQAVSGNGTLKWLPNTGVPVCVVASSQTSPVIASDAAGGAIIAWKDSRGLDADVYAQRLNSTGTALWTPGGVGICVTSGQQSDVRITPDQLGGAYIVWRDPRNGNMNNDIFAQSVDPNGNARWTANGVAVCNAPQNQFEPAISGDGRFGLLVSWTDMRSTVDRDIFAQRMKPDGTARWTANGVPVCATINDQQTSKIVSDGFGGAIVGWTDGRVSNTYPDIYAQRVDSTGANVWLPTATGVAICVADSAQNLETVIPDGSGGAILGWDDARRAGPALADLYAQRISLAGTVRWQTDGVRFATGANTRILSSSAPDGFGGVLFAWQDNRNAGNANTYAIRMTSVGTGVEASGSPRISTGPMLAKPNPFNPQTTIEFTLDAPTHFELSILDVQGRLVRTLAAGTATAGTHSVAWNGAGQNGAPSASGAYFAVLSTPTERRVTSLRLIR